MIPFADALKTDKILILDGATGTQLAERCGVTGAMTGIEYPEVVNSVHADYRAAGADIVLSNTFTGNRIALQHASLADDFERINSVGVKLCREGVGDDCYVAGDMSTTGQFMEPLGEFTEEQFFDNAAEQARALEANGADLIMIETMTDVREAAIAVRAAKKATQLAVIASISFDPVGDSFRTMMGDTPEKAAHELTEAGADVVGSNCGTIDPVEMSRLIAELRLYTSAPLMAMPNAGKPELINNEVVVELSPKDFAEGVLKCVGAGAKLVGGCCGTTPAHIFALKERLR